MHSPLNELAERVWQQTRPALRRRRITRRAFAGLAAAIAIGLLATAVLPFRSPSPVAPPVAVEKRPAEPPSGADFWPEASLAVLIVGDSGSRFAQLRPDEMAGEGLAPDLTLDPVITIALLE